MSWFNVMVHVMVYVMVRWFDIVVHVMVQCHSSCCGPHHGSMSWFTLWLNVMVYAIVQWLMLLYMSWFKIVIHVVNNHLLCC